MVYEIGSEFEFDYEFIMLNKPKVLEDVFQTSDYTLVCSGRCGIWKR